MYETLIYEKAGNVATIALNRPEVLNAFNGQLHHDLHDALHKASEDDQVRCVVLRGEGSGFSAGADLRSVNLQRDGAAAPDLGDYLRKTYSRTITKITSMEKPVVAALHGPVYGAGVGFALACDLRVAAESVRCSVAFIKIGLIPDAGVSYFLPRVVGLGKAMEMSMLGGVVESDEAL